MRYIIIILTISVLISCNQVEKKDNSSNVSKSLTELSESKTLQADTASILDKKLENECLCPEPFNTTKTQVKILYGDRFLKFCAWDYDTVSNRTFEFRIYDDRNSILLNGNIPTVFKIEKFNSPISFIQYSKLPKELNSRWEYIPVFEYKIVLIDNEFVIQEKFILKPLKVSVSFQDSIYSVFENQPEHDGNWDTNNPPFATEKYIMELFICAMNDNKDCINAFDNLNTRFVTDGSIGELYLELYALLQSYKEINNF
jgi:hypothetical protein